MVRLIAPVWGGYTAGLLSSLAMVAGGALKPRPSFYAAHAAIFVVLVALSLLLRHLRKQGRL